MTSKIPIENFRLERGDTTGRQRWDNATGTGSLNGPSGSQPKSRDSFAANWSDALGRMIASANYGTNNNAGPPTRPNTVPASSDTVLVSQTRYNSAGEGFETVDASGKIDRTIFDAVGRTIKTIQNVQSSGSSPGNEQNVTVEQAYSGGHMVTLTAKNPETGDQVTTYTYGVALSNSDIASNDILRSETYPDSVDSSDKVTYTYNRQGQPTTKTDQNGSVHTYSYDKLARQTVDSITTLGSGVDGAVRRIGQTYEVRGMLENITSFSDTIGTTPVNQVRNAYNDFGQPSIQYQAHSGVVNTSTSPKVEYTYEDGSANTIRPTSITYPDSKVLTYLYDNTESAKLSRVRTLDWDGTEVCQYGYLGRNTFIRTDYIEPQVKLDYALGSGANRYDGFDQFGRIINLPWINYGSSTDLVHLKYGYDRVSNRTWRKDLVAQANGESFDELYGHDGMQRLKTFERGLLNSGHTAITGLTFEQDWQLDATGHWNEFEQTIPGSSSLNIEQARTSNTVNEITDIDNSAGTAWTTPTYDRNGNSTLFPMPSNPTDSFTATWDAWNRLISIHDGSTTVATYSYSGNNWRIKKVSSGDTRHYYYSSNWQVLEERLGTTATLDRQFVWGMRYLDDLVLRERDTDGNGSLDERLYPLQDANWNVTAIADASGTVQERYSYQAYGTTQVLTPTFTNRSTSSFAWEITYGSYRFDIDTALFQIRNRYLNSVLGTWCSRDPIGFEGSPYNLYEYCRGAPLVEVDPSGEFGCRLKSANAFQITENCSAYEDANKLKWIGFAFKSDFDFESCCECCSFRQLVVKGTIEIVLNDGTKKPITIRGGNGPEEDCATVVNPKTGKPEKRCLGDPFSDPLPSENWKKCGYSMRDNPRHSKNYMIALLQQNGIRPGSFSQVNITWEFRQEIYDWCMGTTIWQQDFKKSCGVPAAFFIRQ